MVTPITIPKLGLTMTKATIVKWLKNEGEQVKKGERLVQIETEKVTHVIEAAEQGVILKILAQAKAVAPVGGVIGYIGQPGEAIPAAPAPAPAQAAATGTAGVAPAARVGAPLTPGAGTQAEPRPATAGPARISPRAKMLALDKNVDLARLSGRGPMGMIMEEDVLEYIQNKLSKTSQGLTVKQAITVSPTRRAIGDNMVSSLQGMAQVTLTTEVDAFELHKLHLGWPRSGDGQSDSRPTYTDIFVKVVADLLGAHPLLNSTLEEDLIKVIEEINIGVAVAAETGLIVPVVKDADKKKVSEISAALRALADKSKTGALGMDDVMGGTFTITNLGRYDVDAFTPIINPPQAAILGVGRIVERPTVRYGKVVVGPTLVLSLTFDHRVMDGHVAATFLKALKQALENPDGLQALLRLEG